MRPPPTLELIESAPARDPRQDPRIGDRLVLGRQHRTVVAWRQKLEGKWHGEVEVGLRGKPCPEGYDLLRYQTPSGGRATIDLPRWRAWAAGATVLEVAQDRAEDEPPAWLEQLGILRLLPVEVTRDDGEGWLTTETKGWVLPWGEIRVTTQRVSAHSSTVTLDLHLRTGPVITKKVDHAAETIDARHALWFAYGAFVVATSHHHNLGAIAGAWATRASPGVLVKT